MTEIKQTGSLDLRSAKAAKDTAIENSDAINITPWFSYGPLTIDNVGEYWSSSNENYQVLDDGWGRFDEENTSSSDVNKDIAILPQDVFELGQEYTFLLEWRNVIATGSTNFYCANDPDHYQFVQSDENSGVQINLTTNSSGSDRRFITCTLSASDPNVTRAIFWRATVHANSSISGEFRLSVYKGRYYGGYRAYIDQSLRNRIANNSIGGRNLLRKTATLDASDTARTRSTVTEPGILRVTPTTSAAYFKVKVDYLDYKNYGPGVYTVSFDARLPEIENPKYTDIKINAYIGYSKSSRIGSVFGSGDSYSPARLITTELTHEWQRFSTIVRIPYHLTSGTTDALVAGSMLSVELQAAAKCHPVEYRHIKLEIGDTATEWTPAPEDVENDISSVSAVANAAAPKATAIKRTQRIYYRSNSSTKPTTPGTASANWVTQSGDIDATWTTMHVPITDTYKYIYTCEQSETNAGVVGYTTVLRDNTITVIDGGNIITGTIDANKINADSGVFSTANIPALTADHIKTNVISAINNSGTGTINANKINAANLSIGYSQITNPPTIPTQSSIEDAAKTATNYISAGANGIKIANTNPGSASSYQLQTSSSTSFYIGNVLKSSINSDGLYVYDSASPIASFTAAGMTVVGGRATLLADYHSLQLTDRNSVRYLHVSDLRDATGHAQITDTFIGDGTTTDFKLNYLPNGTTNSDFNVSVSDSSGGSWSYYSGRREIQFTSAPTDKCYIYVSYETHISETDLKAYTLGTRYENSNIGSYSYVLGRGNTASGSYSYAEGSQTSAKGCGSHAEGALTDASGWYSHAEGHSTTSLGTNSHSEGYGTSASGAYSHAEGYQTIASGKFYSSHAEGYKTTASGNVSHAEGNTTTASGNYSHAEGASTTASGTHSHAEGQSTTASGNYSHAEGYLAVASGNESHAMGHSTEASGIGSFAGGSSSQAKGSSSIAFGPSVIANNNYSVALGSNLIANGESQTVFGRYNVEDTNQNYAFIIGWGSASTRKNIFTVDKQGNVSCNSVDLGNTVLLDRSYTDNNSDAPLSSTIGSTKGYSRLLIAAQDLAGNKTTVTLMGPFSNLEDYQVNVTTTGVDAAVGLVFRSKTVNLKSSTLSVVRSNGNYKYGRATISNNGTVAWSYANEICVTKIIGIV